MWYKVDDDGSGYIDKREFYQFAGEIMGDELMDSIIDEIKS